MCFLYAFIGATVLFHLLISRIIGTKGFVWFVSCDDTRLVKGKTNGEACCEGICEEKKMVVIVRTDNRLDLAKSLRSTGRGFGGIVNGNFDGSQSSKKERCERRA